MRKSLFLISLLALVSALSLAACNKEETPATTTPAATEETAATEEDAENTEETAMEEEAMTGPVAFSEVTTGIMDAKVSTENPEGYKEFDFENGEGTCVEQGLTDWKYFMDDSLGYFVIESMDGTYREEWASVDFSGTVGLGYGTLFPLSSGEAKCNAKTTKGSDQATVSCTVEDEEVCTATFDVTAVK